VEQKLHIIVLLLNDSAYGMIKWKAVSPLFLLPQRGIGEKRSQCLAQPSIFDYPRMLHDVQGNVKDTQLCFVLHLRLLSAASGECGTRNSHC
jgi:hypothetical protein